MIMTPELTFRTVRRVISMAVACAALVTGSAVAQDRVSTTPSASLKMSNAGAVTPHGPRKAVSWNARVLAPVYVRTKPHPRAKRIMRLKPIAPLTHGPTVLLVMGYTELNGIPWARVLLPKRPNGSMGWVPADYLRFWKQRMRIVIDQSQRRTYVLRDGRVIYRTRNAVGTPSTPTPNGFFSIAERAYISPAGFLGPIVLVTSGYSEVLNEYAGGKGRFALHGTSLPYLIGTRASHGCIRHTNSGIVAISRRVGLGTPIKIRP